MEPEPELVFLDRIGEIAEPQWLALGPGDNPFTSYAFLDCMERYGAAAPEHGWRPQHAALKVQGEIRAVAPLYVKYNSHGEFVFDWAWAAAWEQAGGQYYPKLLCAAPYSPIVGPRLLCAGQSAFATNLVQQLLQHAESQRLSSVHFNFVDPQDAEILQALALLERNDWQFHWQNKGYQSFDEFLERLSHKRRKEIRRERKALNSEGITFHWVAACEATTAELDDAHYFYRITFEDKGNLGVINREALEAMSQRLGQQLLFLFARRDDRNIAGAVFLRTADRLYGRYWGCREQVRFLHFETCLYQGIDYCIDQGISVFEPGAQGEHKFMRGFEPVLTQSFHWIGPAPLRKGVADYLVRERRAVQAYGDQLRAHSPYRSGDP